MHDEAGARAGAGSETAVRWDVVGFGAGAGVGACDGDCVAEGVASPEVASPGAGGVGVVGAVVGVVVGVVTSGAAVEVVVDCGVGEVVASSDPSESASCTESSEAAAESSEAATVDVASTPNAGTMDAIRPINMPNATANAKSRDLRKLCILVLTSQNKSLIT